MDDIPEGLVEAVARAIADEHGCDFGWCDAAPKAARAAILAHNSWLADQAPFDGGRVSTRARKVAQRG